MNDSIKREKKEFAHSSERENYRPNGKTNEVKTKRVHNLIIVDESGSMEVIRKQAFVGMNETLQTVRKMPRPGAVHHPAHLRYWPHYLALRQSARCTD